MVKRVRPSCSSKRRAARFTVARALWGARLGGAACGRPTGCTRSRSGRRARDATDRRSRAQRQDGRCSAHRRSGAPERLGVRSRIRWRATVVPDSARKTRLRWCGETLRSRARSASERPGRSASSSRTPSASARCALAVAGRPAATRLASAPASTKWARRECSLPTPQLRDELRRKAQCGAVVAPVARVVVAVSDARDHRVGHRRDRAPSARPRSGGRRRRDERARSCARLRALTPRRVPLHGDRRRLRSRSRRDATPCGF